MSGVLEAVDRRTQLVGENRLELLLFTLHGKQRFGINVFKVREVIQCPPLTVLPQVNPVIRGMAHIRGKTISVMDLSMAIGGPKLEEPSKGFIIITEYNRCIQGFLVNAVERIININWSEIHEPPEGLGRNNYLTAISKLEDELIEVIDVEKVLDEVVPRYKDVSNEMVENQEDLEGIPNRILVVDDSMVARNQIVRALEPLGFELIIAKNGKAGFQKLKELVEEHGDISEYLLMMISDIEMPEMDGYTLTTHVRQDEELKNLYVLLHTSLSGVFNNAMVDKVGANDFIPKFHPDELASGVQVRVKKARELLIKRREAEK